MTKWPRCGKRTRPGGYKCVRKKGHEGVHATTTGRQFRTQAEMKKAMDAKA